MTAPNRFRKWTCRYAISQRQVRDHSALRSIGRERKVNREIAQLQEVLKNMSGDELAQAQNAIIMSSELEMSERSAALTLISHELAIRQNESLFRRGERFLNRHGERVELIALGALFGVSLDQ